MSLDFEKGETMTELDRLEYLADYREDNRIEAKRAQGGLPHSLWGPIPPLQIHWAA